MLVRLYVRVSGYAGAIICTLRLRYNFADYICAESFRQRLFRNKMESFESALKHFICPYSMPEHVSYELSDIHIERG